MIDLYPMNPFFSLNGQVEIFPQGTCILVSHKHLFFEHALLVGVRKIGVKEANKNFIGRLDKTGNDECIGAYNIHNHVCSYIGIVFPLEMIDDHNEEMD